MLKMVYRAASEHREITENFIREFARETGGAIVTVDPDTAEGQKFIELYDVVEYPTLLALGPDGVLIEKWRRDFPTISEASAYK